MPPNPDRVNLRSARKGWKKCSCFIFASGTLGGSFKRKYTGKSQWDEAKTVAAEWEKAGTWDGTPPSPLLPSAPIEIPAAPIRITLADAIKVFLSNPGRRAYRPRHTKIWNLHPAADGFRGYARLCNARSAHFRRYQHLPRAMEARGACQSQAPWHAPRLFPFLPAPQVA